jgi:hypothetical protein
MTGHMQRIHEERAQNIIYGLWPAFVEWVMRCQKGKKCAIIGLSPEGTMNINEARRGG